MKPKFVVPTTYNAGDRKEIDTEAAIDDVKFKIIKFNSRYRPQPSQTVIIPAFSEFGCETLIPLYAIPKLIQERYNGKYVIVMGWHGREFLYKHLVDEFWEIDDDHQNLREHCRAFHHISSILAKVEKHASEFGKVITTEEVSNIFTYPEIVSCLVNVKGSTCTGRVSRFADYQQCLKCGSKYLPPGFFNDCNRAKKHVKWLPNPNKDKMERAKNELLPNAIGITARARKCYGRNLPSEFYQNLINLVRDLGYNPVWLGEKSTTLPCPDENVFCPPPSDFEQTLAYVSHMAFTIQFWTASTRLAGLVGTPYILMESPDQIFGTGQEGYRLHLTTKGNKKLILSHYRKVLENPDKALEVCKKAILDVKSNDFSTIMGLVDSEAAIQGTIRSKFSKINWF